MFVWSKTLSDDLDVLIRDHCAKIKSGNQGLTYTLLIGGRAEEPFLVAFSRVPSPDSIDNIQNESKPAAIDKSLSSEIDPEWICEFSQQVVRCLPGGLDIIGIMTIGDKKSMINVHTMMQKALKAINKYTVYANTLGCSGSLPSMYMVTLEAPLGSPTAFEVQFHESVPRAQSIKVSNQSLSLMSVIGSAQFDLPLSVPTANIHFDDDFLTQFVMAIQPYAQSVCHYEGPVLVNAQLKCQSEPLFGQLKPTKKSGLVDGDIEADLFLKPFSRFSLLKDQESVQDVDISTVLSLKGGMQLRGVVMLSKSTIVANVASALKQDLLRSLHSRCELHTDGMRIVEGEDEDLQTLHQFPRRVTVKHPKLSAIYLSDYLFEGDSTEDSLESFRDLFQLDISSGDILDGIEEVPTVEKLYALGLELPQLSPEPIIPLPISTKARSQNDNTSVSKDVILYVAASVLIALFAILVFIFYSNS